MNDLVWTDLEALRSRLSMPISLPGYEAQARMAPRPLVSRDALLEPVEASALLFLYPRERRPHVLLTVRSERLPHHKGQVSLPGGVMEPGESPEEAALREAHEEVGLDPRDVVAAGKLSPLVIPVSGYRVRPVIGFGSDAPLWRSSPEEVARILEVPLADVADPHCLRVETWSIRGTQRRVPFFLLEGEQVWGATAMILAELLWILGAPPDPWGASFE